MKRCSFCEWIPILPWPVWPLAEQCSLGQNVVVGSMLVLQVALGNVPRGVCLDPRLHYKCTSPRLPAELPANPHWLWHAIDHHTGKVLAYVFGRRKDTVFLQLKALLEPFGITQYYTDYWGAYTRHLDPEEHTPGKRNTQKIERKHLTLRTRIKRLVRKTICFSKTTQ